MNGFRCMFVLLLALAAPPLSAATYHVSPAGSDAANCSASQPCRQIRRGLELLQPGDVLEVADGNYLGFTIENMEGTAANPITIRATGQNALILPTTDRGQFEDRDNIYLTFCRYLVVDGLMTFNAPRAGLRLDASHDITVRNGVFGDNGKWGIFTNHSMRPLIENNLLYGSGEEHGFYQSNSADGPVVRNNIIFDNNRNGIHMNGDLSAGGYGGVESDGIISEALIEGNVIFNNGSDGGGGINMDGVQDSIIRNNTLFENHASGIVAYRIDGGEGPNGLQILHNTVDMAADGRYALQLQQTSGANTVRNNILYTRSTTRGGLAIGTDADIPNVNSAFNIFGGNPIIGVNDWNDRYTLTQWQALGRELNSFEATAANLFVDSSNSNLNNRDYHLIENSAAEDQGEAGVGVGIDRDGQDRPQGSGVDIGSDEYSACPVEVDELTVVSQTIAGSKLFQACRLIRTDPGVTVAPDGTATMRAPSVRLGPGFRVEQGGVLRAGDF